MDYHSAVRIKLEARETLEMELKGNMLNNNKKPISKWLHVVTVYITFLRAAQVAQWFSVAFSPGRDPGDPGSGAMSGSLHGAYVLPLFLSLCVSLMNE